MVKSLCSIRLSVSRQTLILQLETGSYGSLELVRLEQLASEFRKLSRTCSANDVILDLSAVTTSGSGLLSCLGQFCDELERNDKRLTVCSDRFGLIARVGWSQRMNLQVDLDQALMQRFSTLGGECNSLEQSVS